MTKKALRLIKGYTYTLYGFVLRSEFPCPELAVSKGKPDVVLRYGKVSEVPADPLEEDHPTEDLSPFVLHVPGVAKYLVRDGCEVIVEPSVDSLESDIRLWLFGSTFSALLNQRGMLALHASGIETKAGAILFAGPSGIGKSTLVTAFIQRGYRMLTDDVSGIATDESATPVVMPGIPRVKLWEDAMDRLGIETGSYRRLRPGVTKYDLPMRRDIARWPLPLCRVYVIRVRDDEASEIERLTKLAGFETMLEHTHRKHFLNTVRGRDTQFRVAAAILRSVEVCNIWRSPLGIRLDELVDRLEGDFQSLSGLTTGNTHFDTAPTPGLYNG